ncbi:MAG: DUF1015 domain-containing protein [Deltaproteobacteria bacterium]|nr:DUF1015 domain-containing protein [Deltaproteobacteria bacterium]
MAVIAPFPGIVFDPTRVDPGLVVTPPYDVITPDMAEAYYARHPNNVVRLDLGRPLPTDTEDDNPHTRAAKYFAAWRAQGVLKQDENPALYVSSHAFSVDGRPAVRLGLFAAVRLEPPETGVIRPHEQTYSKVKTERLSLMRHTQANFSPIFALFRDPERDAMAFLSAHAKGEPVLSFTDDAGHGHKLWRMADPAAVEAARALLAHRVLYIADGHHRYETALNYLRELEQAHGTLPGDHPARYILVCLCSMRDPGLVILPAHRMLSRLPRGAGEDFFRKAGEYFTIQDVPPGRTTRETAEALTAALARYRGRNALAALFPGRSAVLALKPGAAAPLLSDVPGPLRALDVTVLSRVVFQECLDITPEALDDPSLILHTTRVAEAAEAVASGRQAAAFLLNPVTIAEVRKVAEAGLTMPRKATFFYPKVPTGLVFRSLQTG